MDVIPRRSRRAWNARSGRIFLRRRTNKRRTDKRMSVTASTAASTQEKLLRARAASARLALLSTDEKNALLLAIAAAIEANEKSILDANREDVARSGLESAMRDRL